MTITTILTNEEHEALLRAMKQSGFEDVRSFVYWAVLEQVHALLAETR